MRFCNTKKLRLILPALVLSVSLAMTGASAIDMPITLESLPATDIMTASIGQISANNTAAGLVRTAEEMDKAKADIDAKKAAEEAARKAAEEKARQQAEAARKAALQHTPTYGRTVTRSDAYAVTESVAANGKAMGEFKLTFYCACRSCSGGYGAGTATGTRCTEGRTIAVDPRVIPLGSKVYIEGFGDFIAEDTGGAIKGNKIDIYLNDHDRCYALGVARASVYVMS